jgi:N-acetyl-anhydromuramyl-L-alanine amidase AmpD
MSKTRPKKSSIRAGIRAFLWLVAVAGLLAAAIWAFDRGHRSNLYREPHWLPENKSDRWKCIVIHHSAGETGGADRFDGIHRKKGWDELGYHFVIGNGTDTADGQVEVGPRWLEQKHGAHCKTDDHYYNEHGIGICLVGNFDNHPPDERQVQALARLVRFLCAEFKIPPNAIYTHGGVTGKTRCPGKQFDLLELKRMIQGR